MRRRHSIRGLILGILSVSFSLAPGPRDDSKDRVVALATERLKIAKRALEGLSLEITAPPATNDIKNGGDARRVGLSWTDRFIDWKGHELEAKMDLADTAEERASAVQAHIEDLKRAERLLEEFARGGIASSQDVDRVKIRRLEFETRLVREQPRR